MGAEFQRDDITINDKSVTWKPKGAGLGPGATIEFSLGADWDFVKIKGLIAAALGSTPKPNEVSNPFDTDFFRAMVEHAAVRRIAGLSANKAVFLACVSRPTR